MICLLSTHLDSRAFLPLTTFFIFALKINGLYRKLIRVNYYLSVVPNKSEKYNSKHLERTETSDLFVNVVQSEIALFIFTAAALLIADWVHHLICLDKGVIFAI